TSSTTQNRYAGVLRAEPHFLSLSSSKRRRGPGRGGTFYRISPLSSSLPARSSQGERRSAHGLTEPRGRSDRVNSGLERDRPNDPEDVSGRDTAWPSGRR